ncbi:MAG TPA: enoyl-CoA hydratase-related protein, partial [Gemmatimonadaceae bacterium]|nr:enoyl-CoA hydratase-related protein [Gemmatimonadaceae bacterium]
MKLELETIDYRTADRVARITLNRPERLNAITSQLVSDLRTAIVAANEDAEVSVLILSGAGRAFCAGYDLDWGTRAEDANQRAMAGQWDPVRDYLGMSRNVRVYMSIWESPKPVIAQVHGWCVGGGTDLALCSDLI